MDWNALKKGLKKRLIEFGYFILGLIGVVIMAILGIIANTLIDRWLG